MPVTTVGVVMPGMLPLKVLLLKVVLTSDGKQERFPLLLLLLLLLLLFLVVVVVVVVVVVLLVLLVLLVLKVLLVLRCQRAF